MYPGNPLPEWIIFLFPFFLAGYYFSFRYFKNIISADSTALLLSTGVFTAGWLGLAIISARIFSSFTSGIFFSTCILFAALLFWYLKCTGQNISRTGIQSANDDYHNRSFLKYITGIAATLIIVIPAIKGHFHDELFINGHRAIIAQLQNNTFPPENLMHPAELLRYHFGFDMLCAAITGFFRCNINTAIDTVTILSFFYCWVALWIAGEKLFSSRYAGALVSFITLFGGGLAPITGLISNSGSTGARLLGLSSRASGFSLNPPVISYVFQHPFGIGFVLVCTTLLIIVNENMINAKIRNVIYGLILLALYFSQTALFLTLFAGLLIFKLINKDFNFIFCAIALSIVAICSRTGLLFTPLNTPIFSDLIPEMWTSRTTISNIFVWYAGSSGLLIIAGFIGLKFIHARYRSLFLMLSGMALLIPFIFYYRHTNDIFKFNAIANFYLGILSGGMLAAIVNKGTAFKIVSGLLLILLSVSSFIHLSAMVVELSRMKQLKASEDTYHFRDILLAKDYLPFADLLRKTAPRDLILIDTREDAQAFAINTGLPVIYDEITPIANAFGVPEDVQVDYSNILSGRISQHVLDKLHVKWFIVSENDPLQILRQTGNNSVTKILSTGSKTLYRRNI